MRRGADPRVVEALPNANIAIPTGAGTLDALDIDGDVGERSLMSAEAIHGELPAGPRQHTGIGRHLFFKGGTLPTSAKRSASTRAARAGTS